LHGELVTGLKHLAIGTAFETSALTRALFLRSEAPPLAAVLETKRRFEKRQNSSGKSPDDVLVTILVLMTGLTKVQSNMELTTDNLTGCPVYSRKLINQMVLIRDWLIVSQLMSSSADSTP